MIEEKSKVISIFSAKKTEKKDDESDKVLTFEEVMEKNKKIKDRMEKERLSANKSVLRSYRIKN